ncbi:Glucose-repressible protein [Ptychographa xylographoides]|nr:Glucose-repressible protein [Ptychographa xylographoides]
MNTLKNAGNYVSETVQGAGSQASKEANKQVAKDSNATLSTRATATKDMIGDKLDQHGHETSANVHKEAAKHVSQPTGI